jgi:hypothetical protein
MASSEYVSGRPFLAVRLAEYQLSVNIFAEPKSDEPLSFERGLRSLVLLARHVEPQIFV